MGKDLKLPNPESELDFYPEELFKDKIVLWEKDLRLHTK